MMSQGHFNTIEPITGPVSGSFRLGSAGSRLGIGDGVAQIGTLRTILSSRLHFHCYP